MSDPAEQRSEENRPDVVKRPSNSLMHLWTARLAPALVAPLAILTILPLLVGGVGVLVTLTGRSAMEDSVREMAEDRFRGKARHAAQSVEEVLKQAGPVLDVLRVHLRRAPSPVEPAALARHMNGVIRLSRSVAYLSWSQDDNGDFMGVHYTQEGDLVWEQKLARKADGTVHREVFLIGEDGKMTPSIDEPDHRYDPRVTAWYQSPVASKGRVWTEPYVWYDLGLPGVTCAESVLGPDGGVRGVITCDFDLNSLSELVESESTDRHSRTFLLTRTGVLLGYPGVQMVRQSFSGGQGKLMLLGDIDEPITKAFRNEMPELTSGLSTSFGFTIEDGEEVKRCLATVECLELGKSRHGGGVEWFVVTVGDLEPMLAIANKHAETAITGSAVAVLVAIVLTVFFALHLVRSRRRVAWAERKAVAAVAHARELGAYQLTKKLGEGGMGQVWIAEHRMLARPVAVKLINKKNLDVSEEAEAVERFNREAQTLAQLRSRHTIGIYDFGVGDDGTLFYVMELLHGLDLDVLVQRHGRQPVGRTLSILRQAAWSLAEAHEAGLVHRDVKPANIFLCIEPGEHDVVKVLDFGIVRTACDATDSKLTAQGAVQGTPAFIAPEQVTAPEGIDGRADLYALACVGHYLLTAEPVFTGENAIEVAYAHVKEAPRPLNDVIPTIPESVAAFFSRCMAKDREDRPADMRVFIDEIDALLRTGGVTPFDPGEAAEWWSRVDLTVENGDAAGGPSLLSRKVPPN